MSSFGLNTYTETSAPLVNGVTNNTVFCSVPHVNQKLPQIVHVLHFRLVESFCASGPIQILSSIGLRSRLFGGHKSGEMKPWVSRSRSSHEHCAPEHCPAEIWRTRRRCDVCPAACGSRLHSPWLQVRRISNQCGVDFKHRPTPSATGWTWIAY